MSLRFSLVPFLCLGVTLGASCDGPAEPTDAGLDGGSPDAGSACEGAADGTTCDAVADGICVAGACGASRCGDGYLDSVADEQCDDGNDAAFDGCEPVTCAFTCTDDAICDDTDPCNGEETCSTDHRCVTDAEPLPEGAACTTGSITDGVCRLAATASECVAAGCGNGVVEATEDCDDGANGDDDDGCRDDCAYTCADDAACGDDGNVCNGIERCDLTVHRCLVETPPSPAWYVDCDGDGFAANSDGTRESCTAPPASETGCADPDRRWVALRPADSTTTDCDDGDDGRHPGATEICNGVDESCDGAVDETFTCAEGETDSCNTSCGVSGSRTCSASCSFGACTADEICNGCDDDGDGSTDETFTCAQGSTGSCTVCGRTGSRSCSSGCAWGACAASEACNDCDDDGDGSVDEGLPTTTYYRDDDRDTYGTSTSINACAPPTGYATRLGDCCDSDANVHPGQSSYFSTVTACGGYDYDCSGTATRQYGSGFSGCTWSVAQCTGGWGYDCTTTGFSPGWGQQSGGPEGYVTTSAPACGVLGTFVNSCGIDPNGNNTFPCGSQDYCEFGRASRRQACR